MGVEGSFQGKVVVVAGASGVVGSGVVRRYLDAGATVVGISRSAARLESLKAQLNIGPSEPFLAVVGDFQDEAAGAATQAAVHEALGARSIDHFVSSLGFVSVAGPTTSVGLGQFKASLDDSLFNTFVAAKTFVPAMKAREGATYTIVSGGFAHGVYAPPLWMGTVKNAALNNLVLGLASETASDPLKVMSACIHVGVAPLGGDKNQLGMPAERDSLGIGQAFLGIAKSGPKGQIICLDNWATIDGWAAQA